MKKNILFAVIIVCLLGIIKLEWSPSIAVVSGITPNDISDSISNRITKNYRDVIVNANVIQPNERSNSVVVQYVVIIDIDPDLFSIQARDQSEANRQKAAFTALTGSISDILSLSQKYLLSNPTVTQIRITVVFLDGQILDGIVSSSDLAALPPTATVEEWLSVIPLSPATIIPQDIWDMLLSNPDVQKALQR
jgi:hypothetical protein